MNNQIFRKKSLDKFSSPEQLNDYIRVSNPGVWMVLSAVIILLAGICVWGIFGHLDTTITAAGICKNGDLTCYVKESDISSVKAGMTVTVNDTAYKIDDIAPSPMLVDTNMDSYVLHVGNLNPGEWVYEIRASAPLADGTYQAVITTERVSPLSFVLN